MIVTQSFPNPLASYGFDILSSNITKYKNGKSHTLVLLSNAKVVCFGNNVEQQLGTTNQTTLDKYNNNRIGYSIYNSINYVRNTANTADLTGVIDIACGDYHSILLTSGGTAYACGRNTYGQLARNSFTANAFVNTVVGTGGTGTLSSVTKVFAGGNCSYFLTSTTLYGAGYNLDGQLGVNTITNVSKPTAIVGTSGTGTLTSSISDIQVGFNHVMFLDTSGNVYASGSNDKNQLGRPYSVTSSMYPILMENVTEEGYSSIPFTKAITKIYTNSSISKSYVYY
jgi:hypothetical protein